MDLEKYKYTEKMYHIVRRLTPNKRSALFIRDHDGRIIGNTRETAQVITEFLSAQFHKPHLSDVSVGPYIMTSPITAEEVTQAFRSLKNNRAPGTDHVPAKLLKYSPPVVSDILAKAINCHIHNPTTPMRETALIMVLSSPFRSLTNRRAAVPTFDRSPFSAPPSGFRVARSKANEVWAHRWNIAVTRRFQTSMFILGIDLNKAFDTIDRHRLLLVLSLILDPDEVQLLKALLRATALQLRLGTKCYSTFASNHGTPQGDALSPLLFVVYLEAVLRDLCLHLEISMRELNFIVFADDVDFIHHDPTRLEHILLVAEQVFRAWSLTINFSKTERTTIARAPNATEESWRNVRKLGSLLGDSEDVQLRKAHATAAFKRFWKVWIHSHLLPETLRVRLYNIYVLPILLYNCGTWGLTEREIGSLEAYHRRHLLRVLRIHYPQQISNADLYKRCNTKPLRIHLARSRWRLFGHTLRRAQPIPAQMNMLRYYDSAGNLPTHRGRTPTCLPTVLDKDLRLDITSSLRLRNTADLYALSHIAQDCALWKELTQRLCSSQELIYRNQETVRRKQKLESANTDLMPPRKRT
ncbi:unnamed protein product [Albugo candida]|uniref:Reverse transcriptase domain-containing protein n=1 Tax=Albugo candida TaxID=65357 RepID=A0A024G982_9STRA|nr:unnamed protein product [Albugo candida]|eukprot:CCI43313.1 unnamed protein product [Albugo candida]